MAELKRIDEIENENEKLQNIKFQNFPLEQFSEAGKVANEGDPHLKALADKELYELEKCAIQIDINNYTHEKATLNADDDTGTNNTEDNTCLNTDEGSSTKDTNDTARLNTDEYSSHDTVSQVQEQMKNVSLKMQIYKCIK